MCEHVIYAGGRSSFSLWKRAPAAVPAKEKYTLDMLTNDHVVFSRLGLMLGVSPPKLTAVKDQEHRWI